MDTFDVQSIAIQAPYDRAFRYVADPRRLPEWTHAFKAVADGQATLVTGAGSVQVGLTVETSRERVHAGTERLDHAEELMAHRQRRLAARERVRPGGRDDQRAVTVLLEIGAADPAETDAEQHLVATRRRDRDVLDPHVAPTVPAGRFHERLHRATRCCLDWPAPSGRRALRRRSLPDPPAPTRSCPPQPDRRAGRPGP
jgi:hypothetical protein